MKLSDQIREQPMNWKDWITAAGLLLTLLAVTVKGVFVGYSRAF